MGQGPAAPGGRSRTAAAADPDGLAVLWQVRGEADEACATALDGLRSRDYTWASLAAIAGVSRQALQQWRDRRPNPAPRNEPLTTERTQHG